MSSRQRRLTTSVRGLLACIAGSGSLLPQAALGQGSSEWAIDEVVVTARRVAEDLSQVPMSVQALSGDHLERRAISSLYDLQLEVPGLVVNNRGMFGAGFSLRGVADEGGGSLSVAPHFNGVYLGRSTLALSRQFDLDRIEVVKGPQGTLYGRNATGGSISVFSQGPDADPGASVEAATGSFHTTRLRGHVNLPGESVGARFAFAASEGDGFIRNSLDGRRFSEEDYWAARASLRFQPREDLSVDAVVQRVEDDGASGDLWSPRVGFFPEPGDIHVTSVALANPYHDTINDFASVNLAWQPGSLTFRSITGYARNLTRELDDCDNGTVPFQDCTRGVRPLRYEQFSQEFRVESAAGESLEWLAGLYFADASEFQRFHNTFPAESPEPANNFSADADEIAYALFSDATYALGKHWRVNGGLRFSREDHQFDFAGTGRADIKTPLSGRGSWEAASWRAGLQYATNDRTLLYASVSTGFKSGGVTSRQLPDGSFDDFDPEKLLAYEVGVNTNLWNGRSVLRASAFLYDFEDMQVRTVSTSGGSATPVVDNAGAARIEGIDVSSTTRLTSNLTVTGNFVWLPRREFTDYIDFLGISRAGNRISRAPEWSVTASVGYRVPLESIGNLGVDVDYNYRTAYYFSKDNIPAEYQGDFGVLNVTLRLDSADEDWYAFASVRNLLDEDFFLQALIQTSPGPPKRYEVGLGWRW